MKRQVGMHSRSRCKRVHEAKRKGKCIKTSSLKLFICTIGWMIQRDLDENLACGSPRLLKFLVHPALPYFNENNLN